MRRGRIQTISHSVSYPMIVVHAEFSREESLLSRATSVVTFTQTMGASVGLASVHALYSPCSAQKCPNSVAGAIFSTQLRDQLYAIPHLDPSVAATALSNVKAALSFPTEVRALVLAGYIHSVDAVFLLSIAAAVPSSLACLLIKWGRIESLGGVRPRVG